MATSQLLTASQQLRLTVDRLREVEAMASRAPMADRVVLTPEHRRKELVVAVPAIASRAPMVDRALVDMIAARAKEVEVEAVAVAMEDGVKVWTYFSCSQNFVLLTSFGYTISHFCSVR